MSPVPSSRSTVGLLLAFLAVPVLMTVPFVSSAQYSEGADDAGPEKKAARTTNVTGGAGAASERARLKREAKKQAAAQPAAVQTYRNATRVEPGVKASSKFSPTLTRMVELFEAKKGAEARALADTLIAEPNANTYEKAFAAKLAGYVAYEATESSVAQVYLKSAIDANGLDNNAHFDAMFMLAQLQSQDKKYIEALVTIERFLAETKGSSSAEQLMLKGQALYRMKMYAEAIVVIKQAIAASPEPRADWQALLMAALAESGDASGAAAVAREVAAKTPADKRAQLNLVSVYQQSNQSDKAIDVLEKLRNAGQLTEDKEYRILYSLYANSDKQEAKSIAVINEGLTKGVLKADFNTHLALAQAYYFSDNYPQAIEAYKKAAPLAKDGETYLNLAKVLWQSDRVAEAKDAARQAKAKGLKKPADADKVLALPGK